jgi:hypothetical protein
LVSTLAHSTVATHSLTFGRTHTCLCLHLPLAHPLLALEFVRIHPFHVDDLVRVVPLEHARPLHLRPQSPPHILLALESVATHTPQLMASYIRLPSCTQTCRHTHSPPLPAFECVATHTPQHMASRIRPSFALTFRARGPTRTPNLLIARPAQPSYFCTALQSIARPCNHVVHITISIGEKTWPMWTAPPYFCARPCNEVVHIAHLYFRKESTYVDRPARSFCKVLQFSGPCRP